MLNDFLIKDMVTPFIKFIGKRKIAIWGASQAGSQVDDVLYKMGFRVEIFIDSDPQKQEDFFKGRRVYNSDYLTGKANEYYIFVAMNYHGEVEKKLNESGYSDEKDYSLFERVIIVENVRNYSDRYQNEIVGTYSDNMRVVFKGHKNKLILGTGIEGHFTIEFLNDDGYCFIGDNSVFKGSMLIGKESKVIIGKNSSITNNCLITVAEQTKVEIGDDCMFGQYNEIRSDDRHPIFDVKSGKRINKSRSIQIGNHVWLADHVILLSGSVVGDGSIIGNGSIVKSLIPNNCIAVGVPARVKKKNIAWERTDLAKFAFYEPYAGPTDENIIDKEYWKETYR